MNEKKLKRKRDKILSKHSGLKDNVQWEPIKGLELDGIGRKQEQRYDDDLLFAVYETYTAFVVEESRKPGRPTDTSPRYEENEVKKEVKIEYLYRGSDLDYNGEYNVGDLTFEAEVEVQGEFPVVRTKVNGKEKVVLPFDIDNKNVQVERKYNR